MNLLSVIELLGSIKMERRFVFCDLCVFLEILGKKKPIWGDRQKVGTSYGVLRLYS